MAHATHPFGVAGGAVNAMESVELLLEYVQWSVELSVGKSVQFVYTFLFVNFSDEHVCACAGERKSKQVNVTTRKNTTELGDTWP